jgi:uncharacterized membrane protein YsdA (DUF1294 family)
MLGIIISLFATLAALAFAFHSNDKRKQANSEWRDSTHRSSTRFPVHSGGAGTQDKRNSTRTHPGDSGSS